MWHQHEFIFTYLRKVCPAQQVGSPSSRVGRSKKILKIQKLIWQLFLVFLHLVKSSVFMFMLKPLFKLVIHKFTWRHLLPGPELQGGVSGWVQCWAGLKTVSFQVGTEWTEWPQKPLIPFTQDLHRSSLDNSPACPRAGPPPWLFKCSRQLNFRMFATLEITLIGWLINEEDTFHILWRNFGLLIFRGRKD